MLGCEKYELLQSFEKQSIVSIKIQSMCVINLCVYIIYMYINSFGIPNPGLHLGHLVEISAIV